MPGRRRGGSGLEPDSETIHDAVGVGVVRGDLGETEDVFIAEPHGKEPVVVLARHPRRREGQLRHVVEHRSPAIVDGRRFVIALQRLEKVVVLQQSAQTAPMVGQSVLAAIELADDQRDHLALDLGQGATPRHDVLVELEMGG
jgi:hypothetical protein